MREGTSAEESRKKKLQEEKKKEIEGRCGDSV